MSKTISYYAKRLAPTKKSPEECTDKELRKIIDSYTDYMDAMCDEDGYVNTYERTADKISPWFEEAEKRGIK